MSQALSGVDEAFLLFLAASDNRSGPGPTLHAFLVLGALSPNTPRQLLQQRKGLEGKVGYFPEAKTTYTMFQVIH